MQKHSFPNTTVACNKEYSLEQIQIIIALAQQCNVDIFHNVVSKPLSTDYPFVIWDGKQICRGRELRSYKQVTFEKFCLMMMGKYSIKEPVKVKLNSEYTAEITDAGVKVGCQTLEPAVIENLYLAMKEYSK